MKSNHPFQWIVSSELTFILPSVSRLEDISVTNGYSFAAFTMAASATLSGIYTYNLLRSYDNPEHTQASFCQEKVISYEIVRSTFFEQTNSTIRKDTSDRSSSMKVGVAYEILNTELSMKDDMSTEVEDAVKKLTNIATSVKLIDSYRVTDTCKYHLYPSLIAFI